MPRDLSTAEPASRKPLLTPELSEGSLRKGLEAVNLQKFSTHSRMARTPKPINSIAAADARIESALACDQLAGVGR